MNTPEDDDLLYKSDDYSIYSDRVVQQGFTAKAVTREYITSDYISPVKSQYSSLLSFKFSINGKDNEAAPGKDHVLNVKPENGIFFSPLLSFGEKDPKEYQSGEIRDLPANTEFRIRVDMRKVLSQFNEKGYYLTYNGEKIRQEDFEGVYIAGGSPPLSWDFDNLTKNPQYKLSDENQDGIYEGTFQLNPQDPNEEKEKSWKLTNNIGTYPSYQSDQILIDALYNMSLDETMMNIESDGTFRTGEKWAGVWTRDVSYSIILAYAFLEPEVSKTSLMRKVKRDRIIQDTGSGGAWPVSSDRVVWALAAWEIFKATGDMKWLEDTYRIIKNSIADDLETVYDKDSGLFKGESSFLDWREQTYPDWMDNVDISQSLNLGTNVVFFQALRVLSEMAEELNKPDEATQYANIADGIKSAVNEKLWNVEKGYFNQYLYGETYMNASPRSEALGEALSIIYNVADDNIASEIVRNTPVINYGIPCIYPQIPNQPPYHNNGIWPFVQAYWNWAVKETNNESALMHGLAAIYRPAGLFLTNKENFVAENGDYIGTQINSNRQLWSVAGNLAMVYRIYLGMELKKDGIAFSPFVPEALKGTKTIKGFKYRNASIDFTVEGFGNAIEEFKIDGEIRDEHFFPSDLQGSHSVSIKLADRSVPESSFHLVANQFSPPHPVAGIEKGILKWEKVDNAEIYQVILNGNKIEDITENHYQIPEGQYGQYKVNVIAKNGFESFTSEPVDWYPESDILTFEMEKFAPIGQRRLTDFSGKGFVEITKEKNTSIDIPVEIEEEGKYLIFFRYANGSGPWNTDNKCAVRTLKVDSKKAGTLVMAQRGEDEWSNWGFTNRVEVVLGKGGHTLQLLWETSNENMNIDVNTAVVDYMKMIKTGD